MFYKGNQSTSIYTHAEVNVAHCATYSERALANVSEQIMNRTDSLVRDGALRHTPEETLQTGNSHKVSIDMKAMHTRS